MIASLLIAGCPETTRVTSPPTTAGGEVDQCSVLLAHGIIGESLNYELASEGVAYDDFLCGANFIDHNHARSYGLSLGAQVYGDTLRADGTFDHATRTTWVATHCAGRVSSERASRIAAAASRRASGALLDAWTDCVRRQAPGAVSCAAVLSHGVFADQVIFSHAEAADALRRFLCGTSFASHEEAMGMGFGASFPIYDVPLTVGATFSSEERDGWQRSHCSAAEGASIESSRIESLRRYADVGVLAAYDTCLSFGRSGLQCSWHVDGTRVLLNVRWRPEDTAAPTSLPTLSIRPGAGLTCPATIDAVDAVGRFVECTASVATTIPFRVGDAEYPGAACAQTVNVPCGGLGAPCCPDLAAGCESTRLSCQIGICQPCGGVAAEDCNGTDEDCDGRIDEDPPTDGASYYVDADRDGYGDPAHTRRLCAERDGYVLSGTDCRDDNPNVHPAQTAMFGSHRGDGSFDYNCDGTEAPSMTRAASSCGGWPECSENDFHGDAWWGAPPPCGGIGPILDDCDSGWSCRAEISHTAVQTCN